jgi:competence protein ComEC
MNVIDASEIIGTYLHEPHAGLLAEMLLGARQKLTPDMTDVLVRSGTLHIVPLSGTNITIMISLTASVLLVFFRRPIASIVSVAIIIGFILFVGPSPSVVRAAFMGSLTLLATVFGRQVWALWSFIVTAVVMLAFGLGRVDDVSFQLSCAASLRLILFAGQTSGIRSKHHGDELPSAKSRQRPAGFSAHFGGLSWPISTRRFQHRYLPFP